MVNELSDEAGSKVKVEEQRQKRCERLVNFALSRATTSYNQVSVPSFVIEDSGHFAL